MIKESIDESWKSSACTEEGVLEKSWALDIKDILDKPLGKNIFQMQVWPCSLQSWHSPESQPRCPLPKCCSPRGRRSFQGRSELMTGPGDGWVMWRAPSALWGLGWQNLKNPPLPWARLWPCGALVSSPCCEGSGWTLSRTLPCLRLSLLPVHCQPGLVGVHYPERKGKRYKLFATQEKARPITAL